jgi:hypothetical protein
MELRQPSGGLPRGVGGLLPQQLKTLIFLAFQRQAEIRRFGPRREPDVKQRLIPKPLGDRGTGVWAWR